MKRILSWFAHWISNLIPFSKRCADAQPQDQVEIDIAWEWYWEQKDAQEKAHRNEICARCGHPRNEHWRDALTCSSCDYPAKCKEFVSESEYTEVLRAEWKALVKEAKELDDWQDDYDKYWQDKQDWEDEVSEMRHRDFMEQACQWGEPIFLTIPDPVLGEIGFSMLEGEWLRSFQDMREQKMLPDKVIDSLEQKFKQVREDLYW